ncbi:hydroxylamine reductase [Desulfuribacillus stibiiarsenatis]|uniref:Hydroxylamine reductase n=1 Tax=Desulfuribacillus stibiiarsenatis TaxID=1390249 RepID=A0A1E5L6J9_9FIRM|nr:hydroxylamine reductase [Desulfuribacillus stibiiarsenatis]OEH85678.1 hydroxylamine reductase [Desulfuribacillus stibiiarsenatis]
MDMKMFCYQCEQTLGGKACTKAGVCGKDADVAALQDLLIHNLKGLAFYGQKLIERGEKINPTIQTLMVDGVFSTLTNVNFDPERFFTYNTKAEAYKQELRALVGNIEGEVPSAALYQSPNRVDLMIEDGLKFGIMADPSMNEDIRSLRELLIYGLKGVSAYAHQAAALGKTNEEVNNFFFKALNETLKDDLTVDALFGLNMELGQENLKVMELLDSVHTGTYGHPVPTKVAVTKKKGPFIVISGHDLKDLQMLLEQTQGTGVNIYTHGEMIPAHGYPELKKYSNLVGNYGGAWQDQQKEFDNLPGCVLMTTNCIQKPRPSYEDRIYTTSVVGWPGIKHIEQVDGNKDFSAIIKHAIELGGYTEDEEEKNILVGFGHNTTLSHAGAIIEAVKSGAIKHFFLIGGCDGAKPGRNYFTEFAENTPQDTVILTLACGKYRFNKIDFGTVAGLPRLLDVGQCNDAFSAIKIAVALAEAFECDVNDLPLSLVLSWYEQKAVAILLTLLSLNIKNILLGPSLPAFVSPNVLQVLVDKFNIRPTTNAEADLQSILG